MQSEENVDTRFSRLKRALDLLVVIAALATVPVTLAQVQGVSHRWVFIVDWTIWCLFVVEYVTLFRIAKNKGHYVRTHLLHITIILVSIPTLHHALALTRLARFARMFRLLRLTLAGAKGVDALRLIVGRRGVLTLAMVSILIVLIGSGAIHMIVPGLTAGTYLDVVTWSAVVIKRLNYADATPQTFAGRIVGTVLIITGIALRSMLSASIAAYFITVDRHNEQTETQARMQRIEAKLDALATPMLAVAAASEMDKVEGDAHPV